MEAHWATVWEALADAVGDSEAIVQGERRLRWRDFDARSARLAAALEDAGLGQGAKVAQYLYNSPEYAESYFAAFKIRGVPVNVNYRYLDSELLYLLDNAQAEALVFHSSLAAQVAVAAERAPTLKLLIEVDDGGPHVDGAARYEDLVEAFDPAPRRVRSPDDITMLYTGGTTGMPKGVMGRVGRGVEALAALASTLAEAGSATLGVDQLPAFAARLLAEGRPVSTLCAPPLMHGTGLVAGMLTPLLFGGRMVLLNGRGFDPDELWEVVERERVPWIAVVGDAFARPMLRSLAARPGSPAAECVTMIASAGAMFSQEVRAGLLELLPKATIIDYISASEGLMGYGVSVRGAVAPTGQFQPAPGVKVFTLDDKEVVAGSGEAGLIALSEGVPVGYFRDDAKSEATFRTVDGMRYSFPGDWATVEADGTVKLLGRGSQCINTGGEKVYPEEVEEVIKSHPAIDDCLVFGVDDERFGQRVVAVASVGRGTETQPEEVLAAIRGRLASYKLPRQLLLVDDVPRAANGKADYPAARELYTGRVSGP